MKVQKAELLEALTKVKPGLAKKELIEQAQHFIFAKNEIVTFNDMVCVMHPFECDIEFSVKGEEFFKIINGITENHLTLDLEENLIKIESKNTKATLSTVLGEAAKVEHLIAVIQDAISGKDFWQPLPSEFVDALYLCAFSASKDIATGVRACVAVKDSNVYSTDGLRASLYAMDKSMVELLIPARDAMELIKYKAVEFGVSDNWIHFRTKDGIVFNCKALKGDYPYAKVDAIFEEGDPTITFPPELRDAVNACLILAEGDIDINKMVTINVTKNKITCKAEKERGEIEKSVACEYSGADFSFVINPIFFNQILQHATELVLFEGKAMFTSDNFWHVVALPE